MNLSGYKLEGLVLKLTYQQVVGRWFVHFVNQFMIYHIYNFVVSVPFTLFLNRDLITPSNLDPDLELITIK